MSFRALHMTESEENPVDSFEVGEFFTTKADFSREAATQRSEKIGSSS